MNVAHFEIKQTPAKKVLYDKYYFGLFYKYSKQNKNREDEETYE